MPWSWRPRRWQRRRQRHRGIHAWRVGPVVDLQGRGRRQQHRQGPAPPGQDQGGDRQPQRIGERVRGSPCCGATRITMVIMTATAAARPASITGAATRRSRCRKDASFMSGYLALWCLPCRRVQGVGPLAVERMPHQRRSRLGGRDVIGHGALFVGSALLAPGPVGVPADEPAAQLDHRAAGRRCAAWCEPARWPCGLVAGRPAGLGRAPRPGAPPGRVTSVLHRL
jgi:hypothetical protein